MSKREQLSTYLKNIQSSLLLMGADEVIVQKVAHGVYQHPENHVKSVRVWHIQGKDAELVFEEGDHLYDIGKKIPAGYEPLRRAKRDGFAIMTPNTLGYNAEIEGPSKRYALIYWKPDKIVSVELQKEAVTDEDASTRSLEMLAGTFSATLKEETFRSIVREARRVQDSLLPPGKLEADGYDLGWICKTARVAGGDFMLFKKVDSSFILGIGDSEGKGIEGAIAARDCVKYLRAFYDANPITQIGSSVESLNNEFTPGQDKTVSLILSRFRSDGRVSYVNAGHVFPILIGEAGRVRHLEESGLLLSVFKPNPYTPEYLKLKKNATLLFFTDGLTEAMGETDEMYGDERLLRLLPDIWMKGADDIVKAIWADCNSFCKGRELLDDTIVLCVKYVG